jgi:hypothetical protein
LLPPFCWVRSFPTLVCEAPIVAPDEVIGMSLRVLEELGSTHGSSLPDDRISAHLA